MYSVIFNRVECDYSYKETVGFFSTKEKAEEVCNFINANVKLTFEALNKIIDFFKEHYGLGFYFYQKYEFLFDSEKNEVNKILENYNSYVKEYIKERLVDEYYLENSFAEIKECIVDNFDKNNFTI